MPFWAMQGVGIIVSIGGAALARHYGMEHHLTHRTQTALVLLANLLSFGLFYVFKYLFFNRLFRVHTLEVLDEAVEALVVMRPVPVPELLPAPVPDLPPDAGSTVRQSAVPWDDGRLTADPDLSIRPPPCGRRRHIKA